MNRTKITIVLSGILLLTYAASPRTSGQRPAAEKKKSIAELETALAESLTGATLRGFFTITGQEQADGPPQLREERYDLIEVRKLEDGKWMFRARIRYGDNDVTLPLTLPVEWAGDTPVVVVDNVGFPGLGTYSARVLFHKDHYAGHWQGADHGGHLFGTIERDEQQEAGD